MKAQEIRSYAKKIRTERVEFEEIQKFFTEANEYYRNKSHEWEPGFCSKIIEALREIEKAYKDMALENRLIEEFAESFRESEMAEDLTDKEVENHILTVKFIYNENRKKLGDADVDTHKRYIEAVNHIELKRLKEEIENKNREMARKLIQQAEIVNESPLEIKRYGWKTVYKKMVELGKKDPELEAVRWFSLVYAGDSYSQISTVKGMLKRRGYSITENENGMNVYLDENLVAEIGSVNGIVTRFVCA